jgi:hypothetical protein
MLGHVAAATMEEAIATAAEDYRIDPKRSSSSTSARRGGGR